MSVSAYAAQQWSGFLVGIGSLPASFYVALCSAEPMEGWDGGLLSSVEPSVKVSSTSYARVALGFGTSKWALTDAGYAVCTVDVVFPTPDVDWGSLPYFAFTDALTGGNLWAWEMFSDTLSVTAGSSVRIPAGSLALELANLLPSITE